MDEAIECVVLAAAYYGIPADAKQLTYQLALNERNADSNDILRAAKLLKLKAKRVQIKADKLFKLPLPAILKTTDNHYMILAKVVKDSYLILRPNEQTPKMLKEEEILHYFSGEAILLVPRALQDREIKFGLKWFIPTILKYKGPLIEVLLAALVMQLLQVVSPMVTQSVIDKVLVHNSLSTLEVLGVALIIIAIFEMLLSIARNYIFVHTTSRMDVILSTRLFQHLFHLPLRYFETRRVGDTVARVRELENIRRFLTGVPMNTFIDSLFIIVYIIIMLIYSKTLTLITLLSLPILAAISLVITPVLRKMLDEKFQYGAEQQAYLVEAVTGSQTIKSFAIEPTIQKKWEGILANYTTASFKTTMLGNTAGTVAQFVQQIFDILILWVGATLVMEHQLTVGQLVAFRMLAGRVNQPIMRLVQVWQDFQQTSISLKRLGDIFHAKPEPAFEGSNMRMDRFQGLIQFQNVSFRYRPDAAEVIRDMSFIIKPNMVVGIVGRSGSGKSTISKLVQRLYLPEHGKILIDGNDIALANPAWLRTQIGVVLQENFLFQGTIRENIAIHKPAAAMEDIIRVAKIAGAHSFILELSEGYDTVVGEQGIGLSGGQKQRIAIARALLNNPRILIFDEATSALDYESERIIQNNLKEICENRTVLMIAHRLSSLKDADAIMVVDKGKVVEYGPQKMLIERKGLFYHLLQQQQM